jgi:hypothetical protein
LDIYGVTLKIVEEGANRLKSVCGGEDSMGLITTNGRRKHAFAAFVKAATK